MATTKKSDQYVDTGLTQEARWRGLQTFHTKMTAAEFNGTSQGGMVIIPGVVGKSFVPVAAAIRAIGGNAAGATLMRIADEDNGVVLSHVVADCTSGTWAGETGGTVVTTRLRFPTATGKGLKAQPTAADLTTATHVETLVVGFYIDAAL